MDPPEPADELLGYLHDIREKLDGLDDLDVTLAQLGENVTRGLDTTTRLLKAIGKELRTLNEQNHPRT